MLNVSDSAAAQVLASVGVSLEAVEEALRSGS
jgi:hypothetical protein